MPDTVNISEKILAHWKEFEARHALPGEVVQNSVRIQSLWQQSAYCERISTRSPQWLNELVMLEACSLNKAALLQTIHQALSEVNEEDLFKQRLREVRHQGLLHICWKDLVLNADVLEVLDELSSLAEACVQVAADWMQASLKDKYGVPRSSDGQEVHFVIIAMGKLGGGELNFSSDIDVMFCYSNAGETDGKRSISNQEFFTKYAQGLIDLLSGVTSDGFVYRVDSRLRPFGDSGPLVVNFNHVEDYLQVHGREWERYAFVKARVIYGQSSDHAQFERMRTSFVYRKYIDFGVINTLREMRDLIAQEMLKKGNLKNIKLGVGGIREIEFIVQFFQLVHGGNNPRLQTRKIIHALSEIQSSGYLSEQDVYKLVTAYRFLRQVENRLQMFNDEQTHVIPESQQKLQVLSQSMGFTTAEDFMRALQVQQNSVSDVFGKIRSDKHENEDDVYVQVWKKLSQAASDESSETLSVSGYSDFAPIAEKICALLKSSAYKNQDEQGRNRLDLFMPCFLRELKQVDSAEIVINRLALLLQNILRRSVYLVLLYENEHVLKQLIAVAYASPWIAKHLTSYPLLLDELAVDSEEEYLLNKQDIAQQFSNEILAYDQLEYDVILERVRMFKHARELRVACADVQDKIPVMKVSDQLSWTAEAIIHGCVRYLEKTYDPLMKDCLAVIAFGKLGGLELSYGSDLDLVYMAQNPQQFSHATDSSVRYVIKTTRFAQRLTQMLTLQTVSGRLYDVDNRLRPDGESGAMVPSLAFMEEYYQTRAWTWELQALVRARCVAGSELLQMQFEQMREKIISQPREEQKLAIEVIEMRKKMLETKASKIPGVFNIKNDEGGITDIEFMVQYAVLAHAYKDKSLCEYSDNVRLLECLVSAGFLESTMAFELTDIYCRFRNIMHRIALQAEKPEAKQAEYAQERKVVRDCWNKILGKH